MGTAFDRLMTPTGLITLLILFSGACSETSESTAPPEASPEGGSRPVRTVLTDIATRVDLRSTVELSAEIVPWAAVTVSAEATGRIVELPVDLGDEVSAGGVLARVD